MSLFTMNDLSIPISPDENRGRKGGGKYKHLFFDLYHTLWDFEANARATLETLYEDLDLDAIGVDDFELFYRNYLIHNDILWERYRKGLIKQEELRIKRMRLALLEDRKSTRLNSSHQ